jgi:arylsulfatase A-like enzyme
MPLPTLNILLFVIDDMGYSDLAVFGSPNVSTPHIDGLAAKGMKFEQWISAAPICTPSRASLQTGRYPIRTGCMGNDNAHRVIPTPTSPGGLDPSQHISIAAALRSAGYRTGMSGKVRSGPRFHLRTLASATLTRHRHA